VILADGGFFFSEYIEGTVWTRDCLGKPANLDRIAEALQRLHALPLIGRSFDASIAAKRYLEKVVGLDDTVVRQCSDIVASMRLPQNLCCCHNDLVAENLISTPKLRFIDWEYACDNDPFFDLATIVEHHELNDQQVTRLLDVYLRGAGKRWRAHLEKQRTLYLALLCLWMASRPYTDREELQRVAKRLLTRRFGARVA
jgi:thiamine kinase-like enzyme